MFAGLWCAPLHLIFTDVRSVPLLTAVFSRSLLLAVLSFGQFSVSSSIHNAHWRLAGASGCHKHDRFSAHLHHSLLFMASSNVYV